MDVLIYIFSMLVHGKNNFSGQRCSPKSQIIFYAFLILMCSRDRSDLEKGPKLISTGLTFSHKCTWDITENNEKVGLFKN